jgi:SAM-dependent methyltransferase
MKDISPEVRSFYSARVDQEWERLFKNAFNRLEWETTWRFLDQYLPADGLVLDAGGGPGRYSLELAARGYHVVLFDLTPANLARAQKETSERGLPVDVLKVEEGNLVDLSRFSDDTFAAVLCTGGPLSHIESDQTRRQAVAELIRVARPGAPIFISVMSRYGLLLATSSGWPQIVARFKDEFERIISTGECHVFGETHEGYCHFFTAAELENLVARLPASILTKAGLEGLNYQETALAFAGQHPDSWQAWLDIHKGICTHPFVVDASNHMLFVLQKNRGN